jgi:hypothetical protein
VASTSPGGGLRWQRFRAQGVQVVRDVEVLVDWQNVLAGWRSVTGSRGCSEIDADVVVSHLVEHVRFAVQSLGDNQGVQATGWVYGSDLDVASSNPFGVHVRAALHRSRITERSLRLTLNPVDRPVHSEQEPLQVALCPFDARHDCRRQGCEEQVWEQKLADTMIVADAAYFGMFADIGLAVISDDYDMVPGLLLAAHLRRSAGGDPRKELVWYRPARSSAPYAARFAGHFTTKGGIQ